MTNIELYSNYTIKRKYSSISKLNEQNNLHPFFITGFSDGESYFSINIVKSPKMKLGWTVYLQFGIKLHIKDSQLLKLIQAYFNVGNITLGKELCQYRVTSIKDLEIIINHFENYPLITQKWSDYQLFKLAFNIIKNKNHLTQDGLNELISIKSSMNLGLGNELKLAFPNIKPITRPKVTNNIIQDPNWLSGFVSAEGNFTVSITNSETNNVGKQVKLMFFIYQHSRDAELLQNICNYLECGKYYSNTKRNEGSVTVTKFSDIDLKIIPFFKNYPIIGIKALDFEDFYKIGELIKNKEHLTIKGLEKIEKIKSGMNTKRIT